MADIEEIKQHLSLLENKELVSILRKHDDTEWRPEVFDLARSILKSRGIGPDEFLEEETANETMEDFNLVTLASYTSYLDAETDRLALETKDIRGWILDELSPLAEGMNPGIRLQVRAEDVAAAMETLESSPLPSSELPNEIAEPPCPKCGSRSVMERVDVPEPAQALPPSSATHVWFYSCNSCGHQWPEF
jgi:hypothetical protein